MRFHAPEEATFRFTHMRAFIYSIRHIYYRWTRAYAWNGTYLKLNHVCIGCIQRIQQLSERLIIITCDWNKLLDPRWI